MRGKTFRYDYSSESSKYSVIDLDSITRSVSSVKLLRVLLLVSLWVLNVAIAYKLNVPSRYYIAVFAGALVVSSIGSYLIFTFTDNVQYRLVFIRLASLIIPDLLSVLSSMDILHTIKLLLHNYTNSFLIILNCSNDTLYIDSLGVDLSVVDSRLTESIKSDKLMASQYLTECIILSRLLTLVTLSSIRNHSVVSQSEIQKIIDTEYSSIKDYLDNII